MKATQKIQRDIVPTREREGLLLHRLLGTLVTLKQKTAQAVFNCSKLTMGTLEQCLEYVST